MKLCELPGWFLSAPSSMLGFAGMMRTSKDSVVDISVLKRKYVALVDDSQYILPWIVGCDTQDELLLINDKLTLLWIRDTVNNTFLGLQSVVSVGSTDSPLRPTKAYPNVTVDSKVRLVTGEEVIQAAPPPATLTLPPEGDNNNA